MRYDVHKYLFMGAARDKVAFFKAAQEAGIIEFINPQGKKKPALPQDVENIARAIKILRNYLHEEQELKIDFALADTATARVLQLNETLSAAEQQLQEYDLEMERILPFGEFSIANLESLEGEIKRKIRFFLAKSSKHLSAIEPALILVNQVEDLDYFVAIQNEPIVLPDAIELHFSASLSELEKKQKSVRAEIATVSNELRSLTRYNELLHHALIHHLNQTHLQFAVESSEFELENQLFIATGWVPKTKITALTSLGDYYHVYVEKIASESHETPPTYLQNRGASRVGEDLIRVFDTPSTRDKDPSLWVLFAFALFFSMIVYDAGYGLVFLATALILRFRLKKITSSTKRFISLMAILSGACILWGGLTHSIFGIELSPTSAIRKHSLMTWLIEKKAAYHIAAKDDVYDFYVKQYPQLKDAKTPEQFLSVHSPQDTSPHPIADKFTDNVLLELSLFVGAIHICIGALRYVGRNPVGFGWVAFVMGAYMYIPYFLNSTSIIHYVFGLNSPSAAEFGLYLLGFGLLFVTLVSVIKHGVTGLFEFTHAIQLFADVLSYLRIYALGYAGFIVSETVNMLAGKMPLFFALFVIVFGHILNMAIAILGGTIHGLRLNFLEWYRYSFYGGGKEFRPLELQTLE